MSDSIKIRLEAKTILIIILSVFFALALISILVLQQSNQDLKNKLQVSQNHASSLQNQLNQIEAQLNETNQTLTAINDFYLCGYGNICVNKSIGDNYIQSYYPIPLSGYFQYIYYKTNSGISWFNSSDDKTFSMFPTIYPGTAVAYVPINQNNIKTLHVGDIIIYKLPKPDPIYNFTSVEHRIISINSNYTVFETKGDNNLFPDNPVNSSQIIGRVVGLFY